MTQQELGQLLGVSFQQIQKYEKGPDSITAVRLYEIAGILGVPISYFFEDIDGIAKHPRAGSLPPGELERRARFVSKGDGLALGLSFMRIEDAALRKQIIGLIRTLADRLTRS